MLAPPCKEYSRLKLRPGGPKALRTPQYMDGVPSLSPSQRKKLLDSKTIHDRGRVQWSPKEASAFENSRHQPCPGWKRPTSKCYVITNVPWCTIKAFSKSRAFGCNSTGPGGPLQSLIQAPKHCRRERTRGIPHHSFPSPATCPSRKGQ